MGLWAWLWGVILIGIIEVQRQPPTLLLPDPALVDETTPGWDLGQDSGERGPSAT